MESLEKGRRCICGQKAWCFYQGRRTKTNPKAEGAVREKGDWFVGHTGRVSITTISTYLII